MQRIVGAQSLAENAMSLSVSLVGVLVALPAVLVIAERGKERAWLPSLRLRPASRRARSGHGRA